MGTSVAKEAEAEVMVDINTISLVRTGVPKSNAARALRSNDAAAMRSPVNWALLGLVIERPSYGYELAQRFERAYEDVLPLSSASHIYAAIEALKGRSMIEEVPETAAVQASTGRQPKPHYRATAEGVRGYREWLISQIHEDRCRSRLFVRQLAVFAHEPDAALGVIEGYEQACLEEAGKTPISSSDGAPVDANSELIARLLAEENRLAVGVKLSWVEYARREFGALAADGVPRQ